MLTLNAVQLDLGNLRYRLNTANILLEMERGKDAIAVLQNALTLAKTPEEVVSVQNLLEAAKQYQAAREQVEQDRRAIQETQATVSRGQPSAQSSLDTAEQPLPDPQGPQHPNENPHGPRQEVKGTIKEVKCSLPALMEMRIESAGRSVSLHSNNYFKIQFTAANYTPGSELSPCTELEGMKARIVFFEGSGKSTEGQIVSIELSK